MNGVLEMVHSIDDSLLAGFVCEKAEMAPLNHFVALCRCRRCHLCRPDVVVCDEHELRCSANETERQSDDEICM